jgi:PAS domain S-box-containing protein
MKEHIQTTKGAGDEDELLRSVALQNAHSIQQARRRAEEELLRTREALRASQERLQAALSAASTGTFRWDIPSNSVEWDGNLDRLFGLPPGETRRSLETFLSAVHPDDRPEVIAACERSARDGSDFDMEFRVVWPDGSVHWISDKAKAAVDVSGKPLYMTGACSDITNSKQNAEALREETRILELLNETGSLLASKLDLESLLQVVTDAATKLSGAEFGAFFYNTTDERGDSFLLFALSGTPREAFEKLGDPRATALFGPTFRGDPPIRSDDVRSDPRYGSMGPHHGMPTGHLPVRSYLAVPVRSRTGEVLGGLFFGHSQPGVFTERSERLIVGVAAQAGIAVDNARLYESAQTAADERKKLLDSERAARASAERMSMMKDEFLATLSHELRTPLNAILGWARILRTGGKGRDDLLRGLETIERNALAQTELIEDLLDMSRITSGKVRLDIQPVSPAVVIERALDTVAPSAEAKGLTMHRILDPSAGPIAGDPGRLQQVMSNLLSNAIKFTPRGGQIKVVLERVNSHIEISVVDTGIGINPLVLPELFERFRQGDSSTTRHFGGLGIGLSIVKSLVELHGGTVEITSSGEGQGTTVVVRLPLTAVYRQPVGDRVHPGARIPEGPAVATELAGLDVIVVDDQIDARELVSRVLEESGASVRQAASADEAIRMLRDRQPHVLVSDIGMPDADGYELLRRVRELSAEGGGNVPAIALTAFARSDDRTRALRAGFLAHVAKPVDPAELVATVASVARRG